MNSSIVFKYWKNSATDALDTADKLFTSKKYHHSLFFLHLALEKLLKAIHQYQRNEPAPPIHNLRRLAEMAKIPLTDDLKIKLAEISTFNISARYDSYKQNFYQKATLAYTSKWQKIGKQLYKKFLSLLP